MKTLLQQGLYLIIGFSLGWLTKSWFSQAPILHPASNITSKTPPSVRETIPIEPALATPISGAAKSFEPQVLSKPLKNPVAYFSDLLQKHAFVQAMDFYNQTIQTNRSVGKKLKATILGFLQQALHQGDYQGFMALIELYLGSYYDDIDMLMLLAEYYRRLGYFTESLDSFHMALSYTYEVAERERVTATFYKMIQQIDNYLSSSDRHWELISYYESLHKLSLSQPGHLLRQAQLYHSLGDSTKAQALLERLSEDGQVGTKAQELLAMLTPEKQQLPSGALQLQQSGDHYIATVLLNGTHPAKLMIDTGASITTVSREYFNSVLLPYRPEIMSVRLFNTANGVTKGKVYRIHEFQLGDYRLQDVALAVLDYQPSRESNGLLGMNILRHFRFQIDQDTHRLYLQKR